MTIQEVGIQLIGWGGTFFILSSMNLENRVKRQFLMGVGAGLLAVMTLMPYHPVFFPIQLAASLVAFINMRDGNVWLKNAIIFTGAIVGSVCAMMQSLSVDTWFGIVGLIGIALGYASKPDEEGGHQFLFMGIGGLGMIVYSFFGSIAGIWQAVPFLLLNIPFTYMGFSKSRLFRKSPTASV